MNGLNTRWIVALSLLTHLLFFAEATLAQPLIEGESLTRKQVIADSGLRFVQRKLDYDGFWPDHHKLYRLTSSQRAELYHDLIREFTEPSIDWQNDWNDLGMSLVAANLWHGSTGRPYRWIKSTQTLPVKITPVLVQKFFSHWKNYVDYRIPYGTKLESLEDLAVIARDKGLSAVGWSARSPFGEGKVIRSWLMACFLSDLRHDSGRLPAFRASLQELETLAKSRHIQERMLAIDVMVNIAAQAFFYSSAYSDLQSRLQFEKTMRLELAASFKNILETIGSGQEAALISMGDERVEEGTETKMGRALLYTLIGAWGQSLNGPARSEVKVLNKTQAVFLREQLIATVLAD